MRSILKLALAAALALSAAPALAEPVAVIVNRDNPQSKLSAEELRSIYLGRRTEWNDGARIQAVDEQASPSRTAFLEKVVGMSPTKFAEHWVDQQVRGAGSAPKVAASPAAAVKYVSKARGAVAFVPLSQVTSGVKVVTVNGKVPGEPGYPIP